MRHLRRTLLYAFLAGAWAITVGVGAGKLLKYESTAGTPATAPSLWPADCSIARSATVPTLLVLLHPHCPCSRATVGELARLMTVCTGHLETTVLLVRPEGVAAGWEQTDLARSVQGIPGVRLLVDEGGREATRLGASTSGQTLLYAPDGRLLFAGGITESRGHMGDNDGEAAIAAHVVGPDHWKVSSLRTPVYGCPLLTSTTESCKACQK